MGIERFHINKDARAADRATDYYASLLNSIAEVPDKSDSMSQILLVDALPEPYGNRFKITSCQAAIRVKPLIEYEPLLTASCQGLVVQSNEPANIDQRVFLGAHPAAIAVREHFASDLGNALIGVT